MTKAGDIRDKERAMGRPALSELQRTEARRRIRDAALDIYREGGVEAVSIRSVAQRVGVAASGIYSYFDSRQALIESLWLDPVLATVQQMIDVAAQTPDPIARIERVLRIYIDFARDNPDVYRGAFLYVRPDSAAAVPGRNLSELPFHTIMRDAIDEAQRDNRAGEGDPALMAQLLWAGLHGALALPVNVEHWAFAPQPALAEAMIDLLLRGIRCVAF
ncbi:TetR/AcrR family transcriptional regulator [Sandaracinobacteroides saxicola]|uniref:TetR/AcrR family transcriptional regulator n=1 Tax=Sandaracinobacteroides saxicola TaxID=2759707 RepID=A0A7G5IM30_9SPHN|nr:TetR/AcrR family transcriptional regulator [Sandaracinobacteroides saxicola]QMW24422.1 TetR/AcrR family transcriptional regulator [Sandaracinobacteroides saxicola]